VLIVVWVLGVAVLEFLSKKREKAENNKVDIIKKRRNDADDDHPILSDDETRQALLRPVVDHAVLLKQDVVDMLVHLPTC
jgi:hypothetical protein